MPKLEPYSKKLTYSYALGAFPSLALLESRPDRAVRLLLQPKQMYVARVAGGAASALLRDARGNSGVILSLLFRGMSKSLKGAETCTGAEFAAALAEGVEAAYKAVM